MEKIKNEILEKRELNRIKENIKECLQEFCIENEIENIRNESQNFWGAFWSFCGLSVFPVDFFIIGFKNNMPLYDLYLLDSVADLYIYFCKLYNKLVSTLDFCELVRIDYNIIKAWSAKNSNGCPNTQAIQDLYKLYLSSNNTIELYNIYCNRVRVCDYEMLTTIQADILTKLHNSREYTFKNILSSNKNPVAVLSVVNKEYKWNIEQTKEEIKAKALTIQELPQIDILCKQE